MVSIRAIYENGKLRLLGPVELQEGQEVKVTIVPKEIVAQGTVGKRKLELFRGEVWMSDDFDDPLPDSFWFGKISYSKHAHIEQKIHSANIQFAVHDVGWLKSDEFIQ